MSKKGTKTLFAASILLLATTVALGVDVIRRQNKIIDTAFDKAFDDKPSKK